MHRCDLIRKLSYRYENMHVLKGPSSMATTLMWQKMIYWFRKAYEFICVHSCWKYFQGTVFLFSLEVMGLDIHFEIVAVFVSCIFNKKKIKSPDLHLMKWAASLGFRLPEWQGDMRMGENLTALGFRSENGEGQGLSLIFFVFLKTVWKEWF